MRLGIVGSRRRDTEKDKQLVKDFVLQKQPDVIVSGGCALGADRFAEEIAKELNIHMEIHYPKLDGTVHYFEKVNAYFARNELIVLNSDLICALPHEDRTGGTENTIKWAKKHGVEVFYL